MVKMGANALKQRIGFWNEFNGRLPFYAKGFAGQARCAPLQADFRVYFYKKVDYGVRHALTMLLETELDEGQEQCWYQDIFYHP